MPKLSPILSRFKPSDIAALTDVVARLRHQGRTLYDFSMGEPDFNTPEHICAAATEAMRRGETGYTPTTGTLALKQAVQRKYQREYDLNFETEQIVVGSGAKPLIADLLRTITSEGDEVILATPCWTSHPGMVNLLGATPVFVATEQSNGFRMTAESLAGSITDKTSVLLMNAPSNPCGAIYSEQQLAELAQVLRAHPQIWIVTDDLYEHIVFDGNQCPSILQVAPDLAERTLLVSGVSKAFAMTGWRIGFAAGPVSVIKAVGGIMSQATGCPCSISQAAAVAALDGPMDCVDEFVAAYQARRDRSVPVLNSIAGIECNSPDGAFYLFPSCEGVIGSVRPDGKRIESSSDFATYLLEQYSVVTVPGSAFEKDPHIRISIATADDQLAEGMERIKQAVESLS